MRVRQVNSNLRLRKRLLSDHSVHPAHKQKFFLIFPRHSTTPWPKTHYCPWEFSGQPEAKGNSLNSWLQFWKVLVLSFLETSRKTATDFSVFTLQLFGILTMKNVITVKLKRLVNGRMHKETFWDDENVLNLGCMDIYIYQNSLNCLLRICLLSLYVDFTFQKKKLCSSLKHTHTVLQYF